MATKKKLQILHFWCNFKKNTQKFEKILPQFPNKDPKKKNKHNNTKRKHRKSIPLRKINRKIKLT